MHLDVGHRLGVVGIVADVCEGVVVEGVADDIQTVAEQVGVVYGVSAVEVSAVVALVPCGADELHAVVLRDSGNHHCLLALGDVDTGDAGTLVVVFAGSVPEVGECGDGCVALVVGHAVVGVVGTGEELVGECLDEGVLKGVDVVLGDVGAEGGVEFVAEDGVFVQTFLVELHELHFGAGCEGAATAADDEAYGGDVVLHFVREDHAAGFVALFPVELSERCEVLVAVVLDEEFHLAEASVGGAVLTGNVVDEVDGGGVEVVGEGDGSRCTDASGVGGVVEGAGVVVVGAFDAFAALEAACGGRLGDEADVARSFLHRFVAGLCDGHHLLHAHLVVGEEDAGGAFGVVVVLVDVYVDRRTALDDLHPFGFAADGVGDVGFDVVAECALLVVELWVVGHEYHGDVGLSGCCNIGVSGSGAGHAEDECCKRFV